jgi:hypothetical protein
VQVVQVPAVWRVSGVQPEAPHDKDHLAERRPCPRQKVKTEYYSNSYACNSCSKSKTVDDDGIWHCNSCNYDLCPECAD